MFLILVLRSSVDLWTNQWNKLATTLVTSGKSRQVES